MYFQRFTRRIYVCTRNPDGRVVCNEYQGLEAARRVLETFLRTAQSIGYRTRPADAPKGVGQTCLARNGQATVAFWLSLTDESTVAHRARRSQDLVAQHERSSWIGGQGTEP
jgi:hypothetical protein